jgi:uridine phosphorylase
MGGPSAAIVLEELAGLGVRRAVRVGSCGALADGLEVGDALRVEAALSGDGTSRALGANQTVAADATLDAALAEAVPEARAALIATTDLFYDPDPERAREWQRAGAIAVEMEAAALFQAGLRTGTKVACLLVVSDSPAGGGGKRLTDEELGAGAERLARGAVSALRSAARSG